MPFSTTIRILLFVALICFPAIAAAQQEKPSGQSTITGRVVFTDNGRPVRRAVLKLYTHMKLRPARTIAANISGEFRFSEVAAGSYFVVAEAPGVLFPRSAYTMNEFGIGTDTETEQTQVSVDGKNSVHCEVKVARAGTIRGAITYADKEPVVGGRIVLFRRKDGVVTPLFAEPETTNDRGMYRIDGLPDGEYFVGVAAGKVNLKLPDETGLPTAYYPGVASITEAKAIQIQSASDVAGMNITLADEPVRQVSGVVKWRQNGTVAENVSLILRRTEEPKVDLSLITLYESMSREATGNESVVVRDFEPVFRSVPPFAQSDKKGEWTFTDIPPGKYVITAFGSPPSKKEKVQTANGEIIDQSPRDPELDEKRMVVQKLEVTIDDEDLKGLTIELPNGNKILGTVTVEGSEAVKASIMVDQKGGNEIMMVVSRFSNPDGTFILEGIPTGEVILDADVSGFRDFYLKSITLGSQDLLREPLVVTEGAEVTGVRIDIGKGMAVLTGRVQFKEDASPVAGGGVLLVKTDSKLWHLRSSRRVAMTNAAGEFQLACAPGEYLVFTWPAGAQPLQSIEEFVRMHAATARTISLQSKEEKQIEFTVAKPKK
ncbi:MAG TPA: carboxypeptidase-like regulatory domain-containing protein [Pyrinomonadaceae bacterium]|nr:carboxypeptidase-like regulatory domain-containing protein [Pyrinomonadaceae bacterium]